MSEKDEKELFEAIYELLETILVDTVVEKTEGKNAKG